MQLNTLRATLARSTSCAVLAALLLSACGGLSGSPSKTHSASTMTYPTAPTDQTFCLGRFLIDVPKGAHLYGAGYKYDFARIDIPKKMSQIEAETLLVGREKNLQSAKHRSEPSLLRKAVKLERDAQVLAFWEEEFSRSVVEIEGYRWERGNLFLLKAEADVGRQEPAVLRMGTRLADIRPRPDTDIPTEPGYCFQGGFIANAEWTGGEEVNISFRFPDHPDAVLLVWFYPLAAHKRDKPLLSRMNSAAGVLGSLMTRVHVLRQGNREVGGFKGQEYLAAGPNSGGLHGQMFKWETEGEGTLQEPAIRIELQTARRDDKGNAQRSSLSDEDAMALWDRILPSFRVRPTGNAPGKTSEAVPLAPAGPMLAASGQPCPASGQWECTEHGQTSRRHIRIGQTMPQGVFAAPQSTWQKLRGERPTYAVPAVWTLVSRETGSTTTPAP